MSEVDIRSIESFPVEIIHRILDNLDIQTIFFSIRPVCRLFQSIVNNYHRLDFHLKIISKHQFEVLCRIISPSNIRSLTLHENKLIPDQISLFLPRIRLRQLTRLHSIHLYGIDEFQLTYLCKRINFELLQSFSIQIEKYDERRRKTTTNYLSTILKQSNLRKMELIMKRNRISAIEWPMNCSIECLKLNGDIYFDNLVRIFSCSPQLHRLILKGKFSSIIDDHLLTSPFSQLTSLILEEVNVTINQLESFLSLTPSLISLKLLGDCEIFDGKRWEEFIQVNLPHLDQLEFDITCRKQTSEDLKLILQSYQSPFWIEYKKWFVRIEFDLQDSYHYQIYTIPRCKSIYKEEFKSSKISLSTSTEIFPRKKIDEIFLKLKISLDESMLRSMNIHHFPHVRKLHLDFDGSFSLHLIKCLPERINFSQLIEVNLESLSFNNDNEGCLYKMLKYLKQSSQLSSLIIHSRYSQYRMYPYLEKIYQILPRQIHHLKIPIKEPKQIPMIFERCSHLAILQLETKQLQVSMKMKKWFEDNTIDSIFQRSNQCDTIWIGNQIQQNDSNYKRMKLSDE